MKESILHGGSYKEPKFTVSDKLKELTEGKNSNIAHILREVATRL